MMNTLTITVAVAVACFFALNGGSFSFVTLSVAVSNPRRILTILLPGVNVHVTIAKTSLFDRLDTF